VGKAFGTQPDDVAEAVWTAAASAVHEEPVKAR